MLGTQQKGRDSPRPLGAFGFVQTAAFPDGLRRLMPPFAAQPVAETATRRIGLFRSESPPTLSPSSRLTPVDPRGNLRPLISTPDNVHGCCVPQSVARPHAPPDSQSAIAGGPPSLPRHRCRKLDPRWSTASRFSATSMLSTQSPAPIACSSNLKTFPRACINLGMDLRA
jgi:hypothetical protein